MRTSASVSSPHPSTVILTLGIAALLAAGGGEGPAATLAPDALDAPAPTAVEEAARSAGLAAQMTTGGHGLMHGSPPNYRQIDAGRVVPPNAGRVETSPAAKPKAKPSPSPSPSAHEHHR